MIDPITPLFSRIFIILGIVMIFSSNPTMAARGWVWLPIAIATYLVISAIERERDQ